MKTILRAIAIAAAFAAVGSTASAQALTPADVNVSVTLTSQCRWNATNTAPSGLAVAFGTYTAFQSGDLTPSETFTVECTRGFGPTPTVTWDPTNGLANGDGVLAGLRYSLAVTGAESSAGTAPVLATAGNIGTPRVVEFTIDGTMVGGQAGTDTSGAASHTRELTLTF